MTDEDKTAKKKNYEIDQELNNDRKRIKEEVKLLLLGTVTFISASDPVLYSSLLFIRAGGVWKEHNIQADEDYIVKWWILKE